jgi:UDP-N-acetylglucosamine 2-epimerase (non-hydrolysing)/GDP/UDP-N,N'-diacetylbacillosamine 2-epimerase (hydrolysing)
MRRIASITGSRADYGLMEPVYRAIVGNPRFDFHLVITGMHHLPEFASSLAQVRNDSFGSLHEVKLPKDAECDSGKSMSNSIGHLILGLGPVFDVIKPDIVLLQGDRGEMLAAAIAATHMGMPIVHMSGGDFSGSIDDSVRNAISKLSHFHLTTCDASTRRLISLGELRGRIVEVGEPALDLLRTMEFLPIETLAAELSLEANKPFILATLHPVTDERNHAATQMATMLDALGALDMPAVVTYPNNDSGGRAMREVLESRRGQPLLRIVPNLGSRRYLSLLRHAAVMIGNSSSGIIEAPALKIPVVNIGSRQHNRVRAANVIDVPHQTNAIVNAVRFALGDANFRRQLAACTSPYGNAHAADRTVEILSNLRLDNTLLAKWREEPDDKLLVSATYEL